MNAGEQHMVALAAINGSAHRITTHAPYNKRPHRTLRALWGNLIVESARLRLALYGRAFAALEWLAQAVDSLPRLQFWRT
jgi:hypothetical protein